MKNFPYKRLMFDFLGNLFQARRSDQDFGRQLRIAQAQVLKDKIAYA